MFGSKPLLNSQNGLALQHPLLGAATHCEKNPDGKLTHVGGATKMLPVGLQHQHCQRCFTVRAVDCYRLCSKSNLLIWRFSAIQCDFVVMHNAPFSGLCSRLCYVIFR